MSKIMLLGSEGGGKTQMLIDIQRGYPYVTEYNPTLGVSSSSIEFDGQKMIVWECAGNPRLQSNPKFLSKCFIGAVGVVIVCNSPDEYPIYIQKVIEICGNIPVICYCVKSQPRTLENSLFPFRSIATLL